MAVSRVVVGGNSPGWLGPMLLGLGLVAWTGAGAMAETDAPAPAAAKAAEVSPTDATDPPAVDEDADEAFHGSEDGAVNHDNLVLSIVRTHVIDAKSVG